MMCVFIMLLTYVLKKNFSFFSVMSCLLTSVNERPPKWQQLGSAWWKLSGFTLFKLILTADCSSAFIHRLTFRQSLIHSISVLKHDGWLMRALLTCYEITQQLLVKAGLCGDWRSVAVMGQACCHGFMLLKDEIGAFTAQLAVTYFTRLVCVEIKNGPVWSTERC